MIIFSIIRIIYINLICFMFYVLSCRRFNFKFIRIFLEFYPVHSYISLSIFWKKTLFSFSCTNIHSVQRNYRCFIIFTYLVISFSDILQICIRIKNHHIIDICFIRYSYIFISFNFYIPRDFLPCIISVFFYRSFFN